MISTGFPEKSTFAECMFNSVANLIHFLTFHNTATELNRVHMNDRMSGVQCST